jgi:hypothetical protein
MHMRNVLFPLAAALLAPQAMAAAAPYPAKPSRSRGSTPDELRAFVNSEMAKWAAAVKTAGIQPE